MGEGVLALLVRLLLKVLLLVRVFDLVVGHDGVLEVGREVAALAQELPRPQVNQFDVHFEAFDGLLVEAALLPVSTVLVTDSNTYRN